MTVLEAPKRLVRSKRFAQLLPWVSALVLLAGIGAFVGTHYSNTAKQDSSKPSGPAITPPAQKSIPFPPAAWKVAREFIFTAVARKNLDEAFAITHPQLRGAIPKKTWETGELPVQFIPVARIKKWNWKDTNYAYPTDVQQNVILFPTKGRVYYAQIGLIKVGKASNARWLVNYFQMLHGVPVPTS